MFRKKVLVLLYNCFTNDNRVLKECKSLIKAGYEVDLWAFHSENLKNRENINGINVYRRLKVSYPSAVVDSQIEKKNLATQAEIVCNKEEVYKKFLKQKIPLLFYTLRCLNRVMRGIYYRLYNIYYIIFHKIKIPIIASPYKSFIRHKEFVFNMIFTPTDPVMFNDFEVGDYSIIHCNDITPLNLAVELKQHSARDVKIVYDCHEYQSEERPEHSWFTKMIIQSLEKERIKKVDAVITVSESIASAYKRLYRIKKPAIVMNCPDYKADTSSTNIFRKIFNINDNQTIFLYQGALSVGRGIEMIIEAFKKINDPTKVVVFMGYGSLEQEIRNTVQQTANIYFLPAVSPEVLHEYTASADVGILWYENTCLNNYYCLPNKLFEYMMADIPVICSNLYELSKLMQNYNTGIVADEISVDGLIHAINKISQIDLKTLKKNIGLAKLTFNWENQEKILLEVYKNLY